MQMVVALALTLTHDLLPSVGLAANMHRSDPQDVLTSQADLGLITFIQAKKQQPDNVDVLPLHTDAEDTKVSAKTERSHWLGRRLPALLWRLV